MTVLRRIACLGLLLQRVRPFGLLHRARMARHPRPEGTTEAHRGSGWLVLRGTFDDRALAELQEAYPRHRVTLDDDTLTVWPVTGRASAGRRQRSSSRVGSGSSGSGSDTVHAMTGIPDVR